MYETRPKQGLITMPNYNINITITGKDMASSALGTVNNSLGSLSNVAGGFLAARLAEKVFEGISNIAGGALDAASNIQVLGISLQTLSAKELVAAGSAQTIDQAFDASAGKAQELLEQLRYLSIASPFENQAITEAFRLQLAFGQDTEMAMKLTKAMLDTGSALGMTNDRIQRMAFTLGQVKEKGQISGLELRELRQNGVDLAAVMQDQLGMSIDEVNAKLKTNELTMEEVSGAFVGYAEKNYAGAASRMSKTFQGLQSNIHDLLYYAGADTLSPALQLVTDKLNAIFDSALELVQADYFKELGYQVGVNVDRILTALGEVDIKSFIQGVGDTVLRISGTVASVLEWWDKLDSSWKNLIETGALLIVGIGPLMDMIDRVGGTAIGLIGIFEHLTGASLGAAAGFEAIDAALGPVAIAIAALVMLGLKIKEFGDISKAKTEEAKTGWAGFWDEQIQSGKDATAVIQAYIDKQNELIAIRNGASIPAKVGMALAPAMTEEMLGYGGFDNAKEAARQAASAYEDYRSAVDKLAASQGYLVDSTGNLLVAMDMDGKTTYSVLKANFALSKADFDRIKAEEALQAAWDKSDEELKKLTEDTLAHAGATKELIRPTLDYATSTDLVAAALKNAGLNQDAVNASMAAVNLNISDQSEAQRQLASDVALVSDAYAYQVISATTLGIFLTQARDGTLNLGQAERDTLQAGIDQAKALNDAAQAATNFAMSSLRFAQSLKDATAAQMAQQAISQLGQALKDGQITNDQYIQAVSGVQDTFGLVNQKSKDSALGIQTLNQALEDGTLPAADYDQALKDVQSTAGSQNFDPQAIIEKYAALPQAASDGVVASARAAAQATRAEIETNTDWAGSGARIVTDIAGGMSANIATTTTPSAAELASDAKQEIETENWMGVGIDIDRGIANGIDSNTPAIRAAARAAAKAAVAAAEAELGIKSPSKEFARIGKMSMEGFALGMADHHDTVTFASTVAMQDALNVGRTVTTSYPQAGNHVQVEGDSNRFYIFDQAGAALVMREVRNKQRSRLNEFMGV
jgi:tape measure domain-containing protein